MRTGCEAVAATGWATVCTPADSSRCGVSLVSAATTAGAAVGGISVGGGTAVGAVVGSAVGTAVGAAVGSTVGGSVVGCDVAVAGAAVMFVLAIDCELS